MKYTYSKYIILIIGIYYTNLLYIPVSNLIHISSNFQIILGFSILLFFFIINFRNNKFTYSINFKLTFFYLFASIIMIPFFLNYKIWPNDIIRCILYFLIFYNLKILFKEKYLFSLKIIAISTFIIQIFFGILTLYVLPFYIRLSGLDIISINRITGSLVDSSVYSYTLTICYILIVFTTQLSRTKYFLFILLFTFVSIYFVNLSGSRGGLIIISVIATFILVKQIGINKLVLLLLVIGVFYNFIAKNGDVASNSTLESDKMTTIDRFFSENEKTQYLSAASTNQRLTSLSEGFQLIKENYFIIGPGTLLYSSVWESHNFYVYPHNTFIFLYSMFGILALIPIYLIVFTIYKFTDKSIVKKVLFLTLLTGLFLSVNIIFYPFTFLIIELITNTKIGTKQNFLTT